jgi:hypothetical protein
MRSTINLLLICCCSFTAFAREEYTRDFRRTAPLAAGRILRIENRNGRISIRTQAKNEVDVHAVVRCSADTANDARTCAEQMIRITFDESASGVAVRTELPNHTFNQHLSFAIDYDIAMPETAPLDLRNRFGNVDVSSLRASATINCGNCGLITFLSGRGTQRIENSFGHVEVRTNDGPFTVNNTNGNVTVTDVTGALDISNRFGGIRAVNAGGALTIRSNNANIEASNVRGAINVTNTFGHVIVSDAKSDVNVQNQNGEITVNGADGIATLHTSFAGINFTRVGRTLSVHATNSNVRGDSVGDSATIETTFGGVDVRGIKGGARVTAANSGIRLTGVGGEIYAKTSFAPVTVRDVAGPVTVEAQNSSVTVDTHASTRCQPISLRTTFGAIQVTIPQNVGYNLTAHTTFGHIRTSANSQVAVSGEIDPGSLVGKIGAGGCDLRLIGQNGNIEILR